MKKVLLLLLFIPIVNVSAYYCKSEDLAELKNMATNISYKYDYIENNNDVTFNISLTNLNENFYFIDESRLITYQYGGVDQTLTGYNDGEKVTFTFYANSGYCANSVLTSVTVILPTYNQYYADKVCETIPSYKLCNKWVNHNLNYDDFVSSVTEYLVSLEEEEVVEPPVVNEETFLFKLLQIALEYYYVWLVLIIIASAIGIYRTNKKDNIYK